MKKNVILIVSMLGILLFTTVAVFTPRAVQAAIATLIRDQDNAGRHPFAATCSVFNTTFNNNAQCTIAVPAGEEVIVQSVSFVGTSNPTDINMSFSTSATGAGNFTVPLQLVVSDSGIQQPSKSTFPGTQLAWFPADPGTTITCSGFVKRGEGPGQIGVSCSVAGYYVTLP